MMDNSSSTLNDDKPDSKVIYRRQIVWRNVIIMCIIHLLAFYSYFQFALSPSKPWHVFIWPDLIGRVASLGILAGSHRLWSHRSFQATLPLRIFLMILQTMSLQNDIYDWCRDHRLHHKHSDTDADPYNANRGFFFSHMGWLLVRKHPEVIRKGSILKQYPKQNILNSYFLIYTLGKTIDLSDVWADPVVRFQRKFYIPLVILFWAILPTYFCHYITGVPVFECFLGGVILRYVLTLHYAWLVNSAAHIYGYKIYDKKMEPRENRLVVYASLGEGYHNYHHTFPWDYSASEHGWKKCFNMTTAFIDVCAMFGLAYDLKKANENLISNRIERTGDKTSQKKFFQISTLLDYILGFLFTYSILLMTWFLRLIVNGTI